MGCCSEFIYSLYIYLIKKLLIVHCSAITLCIHYVADVDGLDYIFIISYLLMKMGYLIVYFVFIICNFKVMLFMCYPKAFELFYIAQRSELIITGHQPEN